jgi:hypothetical protein
VNWIVRVEGAIVIAPADLFQEVALCGFTQPVPNPFDSCVLIALQCHEWGMHGFRKIRSIVKPEVVECEPKAVSTCKFI